jgi:hypothetical protein
VTKAKSIAHALLLLFVFASGAWLIVKEARQESSGHAANLEVVQAALVSVRLN